MTRAAGAISQNDKLKKKKKLPTFATWQMYFSWEQPNLIMEGDEVRTRQERGSRGGVVCVSVFL